MKLTNEQIEFYEKEGYLLIENYFSETEVDQFLTEFDTIKQVDSPARVSEKETGLVRALHGSHLESPLFGQLVRQARMLEPAQQILGDEVYVYQFKINCKEAFGGDVWQWHQDYIFWQKEDGMPTPGALNAMLCLDDVTEFNGPLIIIPGSHRHGLIDSESKRSKPGQGDWEENVSADLKYSLDQETVSEMAATGGMIAPKGPKGSVLLFHPNLAHGSVPNISPINRRLMIVTYNRTDNAPAPEKLWRPEFLVSRDTTALEVAAH